jgi:Bcr/CflA subfamily drug resistance transporter
LWLLFLLASFPQFSETVYSPALPAIAHALHTDNHWVQWTLSLYFAGFALGVFIWGRLSDHHGRRRAMLAGIGLYTVSSVLCLVAHHIDWLLFARLTQGIGASAGSVLTQIIARESLPDEKRHRFFSSAGFAIAFSIALGPFVGGYLTQWFDWRSNFLLLVIVGILSFAVTWAYLPETRFPHSGPTHKISAVFRLILQDKYLLGCIWLVAAVNGILFSYYAEAPFIFIQFLHLSESQYGWLGAAIAIAALFGSLCSRRLVKTHSALALIATGCAIMVLGSGLLVSGAVSGWVSANHPMLAVAFVMLPMMMIIFGSFGFVIPMGLSTALKKHQAALGTAGALFGLAYYILIALLTAIMGLIHTGALLPMPVYFLILSLASAIVFYGLLRNGSA